MEVLGLLSGGAPVVKKMVVSASLATAGVAVTNGAITDPGILICTTTNCTDMIGVTIDTATYSTTQGDPVGEVSVVVNPDAIYRARLSGGATVGTALTSYDITTAVTTGLTMTTGDDFTSPISYDGGTMWWYSGNNAGQSYRHIDSEATTGITVEIPYAYTTVVGDEFMVTGVQMRGDTSVGQIQLTSDISEVNAAIAAGTGAEFITLDMELRDIAEDGKNNSYVHMLSTDHSYSGSALA